jgi:ribosomal protein S18 acetylase RimI-like enzyme
METTLDIISIRIADHYQVISKLMHELHMHEHSLFDKTAAWSDIETSYMRHVIQMQEENEGLCLLAYVDSEPVGFIFGYVEEQDDSRIEIHEGKELYVSDGVVMEQYRRLGIYSKMNEMLEAHYINSGIKRILRFTLVNNTKMRQFLENEGYGVVRLQYEKWLY